MSGLGRVRAGGSPPSGWLVFGVMVVAVVGCSGNSDSGSGDDDDDSRHAASTAAGTPTQELNVLRPIEPLIIEESDIVKVDTETLYLLNQHTGLNVVNVAEPQRPQLTDRLESLAGQGGELYVREQGLLVLVENSGLGCHDLAPPELAPYASTAAAVVAEPAHLPEVVAERCLPGSLVTSRLVGDILYVVTTAAPVDPDLGWVFSLQARSSTQLEVVGDVALRGTAFEVHVTDTAVYVAEERTSSTSVRYLDISAADGSLVERGSAIVEGTPAGRFHMDAHEGTFRIVTRDRARDASHLHILDVAEPDRLECLASLNELAPGEELFATRFLDDKAYIVTYQPEIIVNDITEVYPTDPLWVVSLEDPEQPVVLGELEIPGWSDYLFPRGELLLAVGRGDAGSQVAASLLDVSEPGDPTELRRLQFGSATASSEASSDFRAVRIIEDELGDPPLVVVPYSDNVVTSEGCAPEHHIQLIELSDRDLALRGNLDQNGRVLRTLPLGEQLYSVTSATLTSHEVADRDDPTLSAEVNIGDSSADDECVLPPEAPQRIVTVNDLPRSDVSDGDQHDGFAFACSVRSTRAPRGNFPAGWAIVAGLWAGLRCSRLRQRRSNKVDARCRSVGARRRLDKRLQGRRQACRNDARHGG